jgi:hypothetical protein
MSEAPEDEGVDFLLALAAAVVVLAAPEAADLSAASASFSKVASNDERSPSSLPLLELKLARYACANASVVVWSKAST